jgi:hypothetical protein
VPLAYYASASPPRLYPAKSPEFSLNSVTRAQAGYPSEITAATSLNKSSRTANFRRYSSFLSKCFKGAV